MNLDNWKNKRVLYLKWKEYYGFIPKCTGIVIEETETECLIKIGWFKQIWVLKHGDNVNQSVANQSGYCKLLI